MRRKANTQTAGSRGTGPRPNSASLLNFREVYIYGKYRSNRYTIRFSDRYVSAAVLVRDEKDESHREEMNKMAEAVNNNTIVMQKLIDRLGGDK